MTGRPAPSEHPSALAGRAIVQTLAEQGVRDVVLAPGSRSAPLAYALHAADRAGWLRLHVRVDERVAGFVALGIARLRPCAVATTSGTAVANLHPAVLEAHHAHLPLLVLSADRPFELRGVGASQTTDQVAIFGAAARFAIDVPAGADPRAALVRAVAAATGARSGDPGPVQVNVGFADPLVPAAPWRPGKAPAARPHIAPVSRPRRSHVVDGGRRGVVVAGDGESAAASIAEAAGWPLLAEPTAPSRRSGNAVAAYRRVLADPALQAEIERVVVVGRPTLSRDVAALLARTDVETVVVAEHPEWTDVAGTAAVIASAVEVQGSGEVAWLARWQRAGAAARAGLLGPALTGGRVLAEVLGPLTQHPVVLGSSMTVRHADLAAGVGTDLTKHPVLANRGLAGIDGTIATATGYALANAAPVRVVVGDLTFLHDVGALAAGVHEPEVDLQVIVLEDGGGSIFAALEHGAPEHADVFGRLFGTPQRLHIGALAAGFGAGHHHPHDLDALRQILAQPISGRSVVEVTLPG